MTVLGGAMIIPTLGGCQDEYPLEPTRCDDWCRVEERVTCNDLAPAECVSQCEGQFGIREHPECTAQFDTALACYDELPDRALCGPVDAYDFGGVFPCAQETMELESCVYPSIRWDIDPATGEPVGE